MTETTFKSLNKYNETLVKQEYDFLAQNYRPLQMVIERAQDQYIYTRNADGKLVTVLDGLSCYGAVNFGHLNPRIVNAAVKQIARSSEDERKILQSLKPGDTVPDNVATDNWGLDSISRGIVNDKLGPFAQALCEITGYDSMLPSSGGAEAVETAIKAARRWGHWVKKIPENKAKILVAENNFHGRTTTIVSFSTNKKNADGFGPFAENAFEEVIYGDLESLKKAVQDKNVCAFLVEPIQGEGGVIMPPAGYLQEAYNICKAHDVLFILDEIQSGVGRTGKNFAFEHEFDDGMRPDGLILAKALGGGIYPVSVFLGTKEVMDIYEPGSHGSTFGGNPVASAIGLEVINILREDPWVENSRVMGDYLMDGLRELSKKGILKTVRGRGLWVGMEVHPDIATAKDFCETMLFEQSVFCKYAYGQFIRLAPPLTCTEQDIDHMIEATYNTAVLIKPEMKSVKVG